MIRLLFILFMLGLSSYATVRSTTGTLNFDRNDDGTPEMVLNGSGLSIGQNSGNSSLEIQGTLGFEFTSYSSNATLGNRTLVFANTSNDNITLTLPDANSAVGRLYKIKKTATQNRLILSGGNHLIDGSNDFYLLEGPSLPVVEVASDGSNWFILKYNSLSETVIGADNLVGWWKFDESAGSSTASDSSSQRRDGVLNNMDPGSVWVTGQIGNALDFDGTDDYVEVTSLPVGEAFTVMAWAKSDTTNWNNTGMILSARSGSGFIIHPTANSKNVKYYIQSNVPGYTEVGSVTPSDIQIWHHYAFSYSGNTTQNYALYLDGEIVSSGTTSVPRDVTTVTLNLGKDHTLGRYLNGQLDDARVYTKALSEAEVNQIYLKGR